MPTREEKAAVVAELAERMGRARAIVLTDFRGLNVGDMTELRRKLREAGIEYRIAKNTLIARAADAAQVQGITDLLVGPTALAFGYDDPVAPARVLVVFSRTRPEVAIKGAVVEGRLMDADGVRALAELPSREVLLARVVGAFQAPVAGLVSVLQAPVRKLAATLEALRQKREGETAA